MRWERPTIFRPGADRSVVQSICRPRELHVRSCVPRGNRRLVPLARIRVARLGHASARLGSRGLGRRWRRGVAGPGARAMAGSVPAPAARLEDEAGVRVPEGGAPAFGVNAPRLDAPPAPGPVGARVGVARDHPSMDVPRWETHLEPMRRWELHLRDRASSSSSSSPRAKVVPAARDPRAALRRQHAHAERQRDAERRHRRDAVAPTPSFTPLEPIASDDDDDAAGDAASAASSSFPARRRGPEDVVHDATTIRGDDDEALSSSAAADVSFPKGAPPPAPDPFAAVFAEAMRSEEPPSGLVPAPPPRLVTPLLDRLTREVTRPKGSVVAQLSAADAVMDGRSVAEARPAPEASWDLAVRVRRSAKDGGVSGDAIADALADPETKRRTAAGRFLARRNFANKKSGDDDGKAIGGGQLMMKRSASLGALLEKKKKGASREGPPRPLPRLAPEESEALRNVRKEFADAFGAAFGADAATLGTARAAAEAALASARRVGGGFDHRPSTGFGSVEAVGGVRPRYVADYEVAVPDEAAVAAESARRARYAALLAEDANREIDDDDGSVRVPFEELPLHFPRAARGRELCEEWDFRPLEPPPPPPAEILRRSLASGEKKAAGKANANAKATDATRPAPGPGVETARAETTRAETRASSLSDASAALVSSLDGLLADLKAREEEAERRSRARTEAEARELRVATQRVAQLAARATLEAEAEAAERLASGEANDASDASSGAPAAGALFVFDAAVAKAASDAMAAMREELRWWYASRVGDAARSIQKHFRGFVGRRRATKRRATLAAGLAYMRHASLKLRFEAWRQNASDQRRHAKLTKALDRKLAWARRRSTFNAWRTRAGKAKAFAASALRLARALGFKNHAAPAFAAWAEATRARRRTRRVCASLLASARRRAKRHALRKWAKIAASLARERVLNTAGDAMAAHEAAEAARAADAKANDAWAAARETANLAADGAFAAAKKEAMRAEAIAAEADEARLEAERKCAALKSADMTPAIKAAWATLAIAHEAKARAYAAAAAAEKAADFESAAKAFYGRIVVRRVTRAWAEYVAWIVPLRLKAGKATAMLSGAAEKRAFFAWRDLARDRKGAREAEAVRAYLAVHQKVIRKHVRKASAKMTRSAAFGSRSEKPTKTSTGGAAEDDGRPNAAAAGAKKKVLGAPSNAARRAAARRGEAAETDAAPATATVFPRRRFFPSRENDEEEEDRRGAAGAKEASRLGRSWVDAGGVDAWVASAAAANVVERTRLRRAEEAYALGAARRGGGR